MNDFDVKHNVESALIWQLSVRKPEKIAVDVKDGVVTLTGYVESEIEKMDAERAVAGVSRVKAVVSELQVQVRVPSPDERADEEIARDAVNALESTSSVPKDKIKLTVDKGTITLQGTVAWQFERTAAEDAVKPLPGVKGVSNLIEIRPSFLAA